MRNDVPRTTRPTERPTRRPRLRLAAWIGIAQAATALLMLSLALGASRAEGALIDQTEPYGTDEGSTHIICDIYVTNDDSGTIYDSGEFDMGEVFGAVANAIIDKNSAYGGKTPNDLFLDWGITIRSPPTGDVYNGWNHSLGGDDVLGLSNIGGREGRDYDPWKSSSEDEDQDTMALTFSIPQDQLDLNRNGVFDAATESIAMTSETVPDAFTGWDQIGGGYTAPANAYSIIPEPGTGVLLGFAALAAAASRRLAGSGTGRLLPYGCDPIHHGDEPHKR